jgi:hypothetical protein
MPEGSRKAFGEYTGQRVNAVPEGFLQAYAQVGANIQNLGKGLGEGIGAAVAMYQENAAKHETADATMQAASVHLPQIVGYFDKSIKGTKAEVVKESTENPDSTNPQVLAYRAIVRAKDDLTNNLSKWTDLTATKKTATIGQLAQYAKAATDDAELEAKANAAKVAQANFERGMEVKEATARNTIEDSRIKNIANTSSVILADAISRKPYAPDTTETYGDFLNADGSGEYTVFHENTGVKVDPNFEAQYKSALVDINSQILQASGDKEKIDSLLNKRAVLNAEFNQTVSTAVEYSSGVNSAVENYKTLVSDPKKAQEVVAGIDNEIKSLTERGGRIPDTVRKKVDALAAQRDELTKSIKDAKKNGGAVEVTGNHIREGFARSLNATTAGAVFASNARASGIAVTPETQQAVTDLAFADGHTTENGYNVSVDKKTGAIVLKEDEIWTKWWKADPKNLTPQERLKFDTDSEAYNQTILAKNQGTFGTMGLDGKIIPSIVVRDGFRGTGSLYVTGKVALPNKEIAKLREDVYDASNHINEINSLKSIIVKRDANGKIEYKKDKEGNILYDADGFPQEEYVNFKKMSDEDKRYFTTRVSSYLRSVAKGLGVLSKQDWDWLNTQAQAFGAQAREQWSFAEDSVFVKLADEWMNKENLTSEVLVPKFDASRDATVREVRDRLSKVPAVEGGYLIVTSGSARDIDNNRYSGDNLITWYDRATSAGTPNDQLTFANEFKESDQGMILAYLGHTKDNPSVTKEQYKAVEDRWIAHLRSKGLSPKQIEEIKNKKFPFVRPKP